jgi:hypothetical protein
MAKETKTTTTQSEAAEKAQAQQEGLQGSTQQQGQQGQDVQARQGQQGGALQERRQGGLARYSRNPFALMQELSDEMDRLYAAGASARRCRASGLPKSTSVKRATSCACV